MSEYFRHSRSPELGVCVLVKQTRDQRTYLFSDGLERAFKEEFCQRFIEPAPPPAEEDRVRLSRGIAAGRNATPNAIHLELEAEIRQRQDDPEPYLVYADWLQQRGDPRGQLITLQQERERQPGDKKLQAAEAALLAAQGRYLMPALLGDLLRHPKRKTDTEATRTNASWFMGFLRRIRLARQSPQQPDLAEVLDELLHHPSAQFLRSLVIGPLGETDRFDFKAIVAAVAKAPPPLLEELVIGDFGPEHIELQFSALGNVSPLVAALPQLKRLVLRAGTVRFDAAIKHGALRELSVTATDLTQKTIGRLFDVAAPALETLELTSVSLDLPLKQLDKFCGRKDLKQLRRLALQQTVRTHTVLGEILRSPLRARLDSLDLEGGDLTDAAIEIVEQYAGELARIKLQLSGNRLSQAAAVRIAKLCGNVRLGKQSVRSPVQVLDRALDAKSAAAARELATIDQWMVVARDGDRLWGEYEGSDHYYVYARVSSGQTGCSCPSPKNPCKHALALLLIAAAHELPTRPVPEALIRQTQSRPRYSPIWE